MLPFRCGAGRPQEDRTHPGLAPPPEGEGSRAWALLEGAEVGEASLAFKCFLEALGRVFPALLWEADRREGRKEQSSLHARSRAGAGKLCIFPDWVIPFCVLNIILIFE